MRERKLKVWISKVGAGSAKVMPNFSLLTIGHVHCSYHLCDTLVESKLTYVSENDTIGLGFETNGELQ